MALTLDTVKAIQNGDRHAEEQAVKDNSAFIYSRVKHILKTGTSIDWQDCFQEGTLGFLEGIQKFDTAIDTIKPLTYIKWYIDKSIYDYLKKENKEMPGAHMYDSQDTAVTSDKTVVFLGEANASKENSVQDWYTSKELRRVVTAVISQLEPRQRKILEMHYGLNGEKPHSMKEIGECFGVSKQAISKIENNALRRIRNVSSLSTLLTPFI